MRDVLGDVLRNVLGIGFCLACAAVMVWLIVSALRDFAGGVREWRVLRGRRAAGLPDTDHLVEIVEVVADDDPPFLMAMCADAECGWMEFPSRELTYGEQEQPLRAEAARHTSTIAPGIVRPGQP